MTTTDADTATAVSEAAASIAAIDAAIADLPHDCDGEPTYTCAGCIAAGPLTLALARMGLQIAATIPDEPDPTTQALLGIFAEALIDAGTAAMADLVNDLDDDE